MSPVVRARKGIGRSFQITNVFPNLTVLENVRLAVQSKMGVRYAMLKHFKNFTDITEKAYDYLDLVLLKQKADAIAKNLAHGEQRKLEIAMLLALETDILLLDEPTAGMSLDDVPAILEVIQKIKEAGDQTILLIEHKMDMILNLSDSVLVFLTVHFLADGSPEEIMENETVQTAYLGGLYDGNILKIENIETYIGQYHILQGVSFEVPKGEVTVLLGRNGAGKTTTLRSIMGLNPHQKVKSFIKTKKFRTPNI